jgi:flagellar hook-associated protein 3 FlgL
MRVSDSFSQHTFQRDLARTRARLDNAMQRVSSGLRVRYASDDSPAAAELLRLADESQRLTSRRQSLSQARPWLQQAEQAITQVSESLTRARTVAIQVANGTLQGDNRAAAAAEISGLRDKLDGLAASRIGGRYIFSGTLTTTAPFDAAGAYQGNDSSIEVPLDDQNVAINFPGDLLFGEDGVGGPRDLLARLEAAMTADDQQAIQDLLTPLGDAINSNAVLLAQVGNRSKALEDADLRLQDKQLASSQRAADLGSADMAEALSDMARFQTGYEATLAAGARLFGPNFFDYIG